MANIIKAECTSSVLTNSESNVQPSEASKTNKGNTRLETFEQNMKNVMKCSDWRKKAELMKAMCLEYLQRDDDDIYDAETDEDEKVEDKPAVKTDCITPNEQEYIIEVMSKAPNNLKYVIDESYSLSVVPNKRFIMLQTLSDEFCKYLNISKKFPSSFFPFIYVLKCNLEGMSDPLLNKLRQFPNFVTAVDKIKSNTFEVDLERLEELIKSEKAKIVDLHISKEAALNNFQNKHLTRKRKFESMFM